MENLLHYNEIARAVRLLCQGAVALTEDTNGADTVTVGSNKLFSINDEVELADDDTPAEEYEVIAKVGLTSVQLDAQVAGEFTVAKNAVLRLAAPLLPGLKWVGQGRPARQSRPARTGRQAVQPADARYLPGRELLVRADHPRGPRLCNPAPLRQPGN